MEGYLITFFTQKNRTYKGESLARWIVEEAKKLGVSGATLSSGLEGFGHDGRFHSENYFDHEDPPMKVTMALTFEECDSLLSAVESCGVKVFYTRSKVEFGFTSQD